jgi:hypothetical protein
MKREPVSESKHEDIYKKMPILDILVNKVKSVRRFRDYY